MQTQSRLIVDVNGGAATGFESAAVDEQFYEAVVRELTRGHELTAQLQAEVLRVLRGRGQAEATAALIVQEVSRAFTVCISIMGSSSTMAATTPADATIAATAAAGGRRARDDGAPRKRIMTPSPDSDGYQWRKYGQKRIMRTSFPRCYYRCSYHRERSCPATKQVQEQHSSHGGPAMYLVTYVHEHTCHHASPAAAEPEAAAGSPTDLFDFSASARFSRQHRGGVVQLSMEELEQHALVSSLACVLQGSQPYYGGGGLPEEWSSQARAGEAGAPAPAVSIETSTELPASFGDDEGLDVMDYDVTGTLCFGASSSYGGDDGMLL